MKQVNRAVADTAEPDTHAKIHTAHAVSEYLLSLSAMCRHYGWHRTGMHAFAAGDELKKMLARGAITQRRYTHTR